MLDSTTRIGARLREARLARRRTVTEVAAASGLTKGFLSKIERDQANPSVAALLRLCAVLEISPSTLFEATTGAHVRSGAYPRVNFGGEGLVEYLLTPRTEGRLQALLSEVEPGGGSGSEPYALPAEVEFAFLLEGTLAVLVDGEETLLEAGDALTFSPAAPHAFRNPDAEETARVLWVFAPALPEGSRA